MESWKRTPDASLLVSVLPVRSTKVHSCELSALNHRLLHPPISSSRPLHPPFPARLRAVRRPVSATVGPQCILTCTGARYSFLFCLRFMARGPVYHALGPCIRLYSFHPARRREPSQGTKRGAVARPSGDGCTVCRRSMIVVQMQKVVYSPSCPARDVMPTPQGHQLHQSPSGFRDCSSEWDQKIFGFPSRNYQSLGLLVRRASLVVPVFHQAVSGT
jgi:hypothetical protein